MHKMKWTQEQPTVSGFYWLHWTGDTGPAEIREVTITSRGSEVDSIGNEWADDLNVYQDRHPWWLGPITVPQFEQPMN